MNLYIKIRNKVNKSVPPSVGDSDTYSGSTGTGMGNGWVRVQVRDQESLS